MVELVAESGVERACLRWHRTTGELVSCDLTDVLAVETRGGKTLVVHSYPLVVVRVALAQLTRLANTPQAQGGCFTAGGDGTRQAAVQHIACASEAEALGVEAAFWSARPGRIQRLAVMLNPQSGTGRALGIYERTVAPLLKLARVQATVTHTRHPGHAAELAASMDVSQFDAVCIVSGDGLLSEVYNGLQRNANQPAASMLPLAIIPAGSGNAIAKSLAARARERCTPHNATLAALCCSAPLAIDAAVVEQPGARPMHALLSLSWALVADIDIESEALRFLGAARFTVQALLRCMLLRRYRGTLLFQAPAGAQPVGRSATGAEIDTAAQMGATDGAWRVLDGPFDSLWALNLPWGGEEAFAAPGALPGDGCFDIVVIRGGSPASVAAALMAFDDGSHLSHPHVTVVKATSFVLRPGPPSDGGDAGVLVLDGEKVAAAHPHAQGVATLPLRYGPLSVRVRQGAARMLARPSAE